MTRFTLIHVALFGLALSAGCRTDMNQHLLERELRLQEDRIFELEDELKESEARIESCRRENQTLRDLSDSSYADPPRDFTPIPDAGPGQPRDRADDIPPNILVPPTIELGPETAPPGRLQSHVDSPPLALSNGRVEKIVVNPRLTGGNDADGQPGDEGMMIVLEPRDAQGSLVDAPGEVRLTILNPRDAGPESRIAQWRFSAAESAARFRKQGLGRGIYFVLPWPNRSPQGESLALDVQYVAPDGRTLSARHSFSVELTSEAFDRLHATPSPEPLPPPLPVALLDRPKPTPPPADVAPPAPSKPSQPTRPVWSPTRD